MLTSPEFAWAVELLQYWCGEGRQLFSTADRSPALWPSEVLLEGAYTFTGARGQGVMADGMWQLLDRARTDGARTAITYVAQDNIPSLRGCANVGFRPDHVRRHARRAGRTRSAFDRLDPEAQAAWDAATAPRR